MSAHVCPPPHWKGLSLHGCEEHAAPTATAPNAKIVTKRETDFETFMAAASYHRPPGEHEGAHLSPAPVQCRCDSALRA